MDLDLLDIIIGVIIAGISGITYLIKQRSEYVKASNNLNLNIEGIWYSAELDFKQERLTNAYLKVSIKRKRLGNRVKIIPLTQINLERVKYQTSWIVDGKILTENTLVSNFIGTNDHSFGYGNAFLRFIGNGRAVGYWVGYSGKKSGQPMYGYWILSRDERDLHQLAEFILNKFQYFDVKYLVEHINSKILPKDYIIKAS